ADLAADNATDQRADQGATDRALAATTVFHRLFPAHFLCGRAVRGAIDRLGVKHLAIGVADIALALMAVGVVTVVVAAITVVVVGQRGTAHGEHGGDAKCGTHDPAPSIATIATWTP